MVKSVWNKITLNEDGYIFASGTPQYSVGYAIYDESSHQLDKGSFSRSNDKPLYFGLKAGTYYIEFTMGSYSQNSFLYSIYINEGVFSFQSAQRILRYLVKYQVKLRGWQIEIRAD